MEPFVYQSQPDLPDSTKQRAPRTPQERSLEVSRIVPRLMVLIEEHRRAAQSMKITLDFEGVAQVIESLRQHARKGDPQPAAGAPDEVHAYVLTRLFEELSEEPSNILFTTRTGEDSVRYDAMEVDFWIECLNEIEKRLRKSTKYKK
jgi:hypothetical protein